MKSAIAFLLSRVQDPGFPADMHDTHQLRQFSQCGIDVDISAEDLKNLVSEM